MSSQTVAEFSIPTANSNAFNHLPLPALPPASDPNTRMKGLTRGHDADRCICISQNFKDRRARATHSDLSVLGEIAPPVFLHQQGLDTTCS